MTARRAAVILAGLGVIALLTPVRGALLSLGDGSNDDSSESTLTDKTEPSSPLRPTNRTTSSPGSGSGLRRLSRADRTKADRILRADKRLAATVGRAHYRIADALPWGYIPRDDPQTVRNVGVFYRLRVDPPVARRMRWRMISLPSGPATNPYRIVLYPFRVSNVTRISVYLDLTKNAVVSIVPGPGSEREVPKKYRARFYRRRGPD